jgi:glycosyltransferase involved in cell wall biosynthesis
MTAPDARASSARDPLRLTHVVFDLQYGGLERLVLALAVRLAGSETRVSVISLGPRDSALVAQIEPHVAELHFHRGRPGWSMIAPVGLARCIRATGADVVHLHSGAWYKGAVAARMAGIRRVVYTEHGVVPGDHWLGGLVRRRAARLTDAIVCVSGMVRQQLVSELPGAAARMVCIENGTDVDTYRPGPRSADLLRQLAIPEHATVVGSIGRLEPVKGYDTLLRAFAAMVRADGAGPVYLVLCGGGSQLDALRTLATELGIASQVRWPGWVDHPADYYRLFDIFALTSYTEGIPLSLLEAMACGVAPVVSAVGANAEVLGPALSGHVVAPRDVEGTGRVLAALARSADERRAAGARARARIQERYSIDRTVAQYDTVYRNAFPGAGAPGVS